MSSRSLTVLHPAFRSKAEQFLEAAYQAGLDVLVYCTMRTFDEQTMLYAQGRTVPGKIVTNAKAGQSAHNYGLAFDGAPLIGGKIAWDDHPHWLLYGQVAKQIGLEWAGTWVSFKEYPHIQLPNWEQLKPKDNPNVNP
jgi:peptidoglycan L-alanyl-D-glutamate endopeptidase CwlK